MNYFVQGRDHHKAVKDKHSFHSTFMETLKTHLSNKQLKIKNAKLYLKSRVK